MPTASRIDSDVAAYRNFAAAGTAPRAEVEPLETAYFTNLVLFLDYLFVHRLAGTEGKDGNPLNEVRMSCNSILNSRPLVQQYGGRSTAVMVPEKTIKYSAEKSILGYQLGDEIRINEEQFEPHFDGVLRRPGTHVCETRSRRRKGVSLRDTSAHKSPRLQGTSEA